MMGKDMEGSAPEEADYILGVESLKGSTTFSFTFAWPVCAHEKRFQVSRRWWIFRWSAWVCPDCKDLVPNPNPQGETP